MASRLEGFTPRKRTARAFAGLAMQLPDGAALARHAIPDGIPSASALRRPRQEIFNYVAKYLKQSVLCLPYGQLAPGKGRNLAPYPFLAPTVTPAAGRGDPTQIFAEQYRWDTYFTNKLLCRVGLSKIALHQLANLSHVYRKEGRVPNALRSGYLSHSHPPLDGFSAMDLLAQGVRPGPWLQRTFTTIENELFSEWWDRNSGRVNPRQNAGCAALGRHLTRHSSFHYHSFIAGVEDGKDHNWVTAHYGEDYLPVQLNCIICGNLGLLARYYLEYAKDTRRGGFYAERRRRMLQEIRRVFWVDKGKWRGFRNFSLVPGERGPIRYGDLAAEIWPLFARVASDSQAKQTLENLQNFYLGPVGLASTSLALRAGGSIPQAPQGYKFQWEENVWPPLMMVAFQGLANYQHLDGFKEFRRLLAVRWQAWLEKSFAADGVFWEKAPFRPAAAARPGFYGNLPGFGWTIASYFEALAIALTD